MAEKEHKNRGLSVEEYEQIETNLLNWYSGQRQFWNIKVKNFPHLPPDYVAIMRFNIANKYANELQDTRHQCTEETNQEKLDIRTTQVYQESELQLEKDFSYIKGTVDKRLIEKRASVVHSEDFSTALDRAIRDGDEDTIDRSNFPGLRGMGDKKILRYKLEALDNRIGILERLVKRFKPEKLGFSEEEKGEIVVLRKQLEEEIRESKKRFIELVKKFQNEAK